MFVVTLEIISNFSKYCKMVKMHHFKICYINSKCGNKCELSNLVNYT